jgi:4-amino-4-deoxy-L-arabinose transferase-like glycosyltransferase
MGQLRQNLQALEAPAAFFWPPGYPLLTAFLSFILGPQPIVAQIVSLAAGALVPVFTALMAYEVWARGDDSMSHPRQKLRQTRWIACVAGLICVVTPQLWQSSAVSMSDTTALAAATLGVWALLRYGNKRRGIWLVLASAALAFAMLTRMAYTPLAIVCACYALLTLRQQQGGVALAHAALSLIVIVAVLFPIIASLLQQLQGGGSQAFLGHLGPSLWQLRHALQSQFVTGNGIQQYRVANGLYYALAPAHRYFFTLLLAPFLLPGLWQLWRRRSPACVLLLGIWPLAIYLLLVGYPVQNFRFTLGYLPPLAIVVAAGLLAVFDRFPNRVRPLLLAIFACALLWVTYGGWTLTRQFMVRKEANLATVRWTEQQVGPQGQLFTFAITPTFEQYTDLQVYDLYNVTQTQMSERLQDRQPAYLLLDVENIEQQWAEHAPGQNYRWLAQEHGLLRLGQHRQFTLFRIGR